MKVFLLFAFCNSFSFWNKKSDFDKFLERDSSEESEPTQNDLPVFNIEPESTDKELMDDLRFIKYEDPLSISPSEEAQKKVKDLESLAKRINESYDLGDTVSSLTDKNMWERLHKYIKNHLKDFLIDGHLSIELQIRYVLCSYIIAFIPGQFAFVIPGFYTFLIPKKAHKIPIVSDALRGLKAFLRFSKDTSRESLFITFYFGRANSIAEDIDFILKIPDLIVNDPIAIIRELLAFRIKANGYDPVKYY
ncbi:hypothetical protein NBO_38g0012 [Nosema bombycis CQ1]|uniref:Uncharacterized protein n=1 Tax=Nosema bombycis (strain CQ1 / CVCC 102059) TaxID=578461 RepID=R0KTG2_NOSB1|nr:hypothetical protein NBO_38g0012 [Nosema bombycis CQ1]|eukprot:EOB14101.1 hypothetical protein NBO_38g0012 [Nosema bombycis CQ1]